MRRGGKRQDESATGWIGMASGILKGSVIGYCVTMLLLLLCASVIWFGLVGEEAALSCVQAACVPGVLVGCCISLGGHRASAMPVGIFTGLVLFALLILTGAVISGALPDKGEGANVLCACLCGGTMGGILGRRKGKKKRRR